MNSHARDPGLDRFKGLLICLIVLGHNYVFSHHYPLLFSWLYGFHVVSFLLFPFLFLKTGVPLHALGEKLRRILVPHVFFLLIAAVVFVILNSVIGSKPFLPWLQDVGVALLLERETPFRQTLGAGFLWFLPALAAQTLLLFLYQNANTGIQWLAIGLAVVIHLFMGLVDSTAVYQLPFSLSLVSYIFVLGLLVNAIHTRVAWSPRTSFALVCAWLVASYVAIANRFFHPLAGDFYRSPVSIVEPFTLLMQDGLIVLSFFALLRLAHSIPAALLSSLGRYSLQIFLLHPFVWQLLWRAGLDDFSSDNPALLAMTIAVSFAVTLGLSLTLAKAFARTPIEGIVFPGTVAEGRLHRD
ncbi:MAG: acyltransferase family protein [Halioglobus sp.]|nr:acyltransferase family protein [Halioglobus sp.]